jgi:hypothetical protein
MRTRLLFSAVLFYCWPVFGQKVIDITNADGYSIPDAQIAGMAGGEITSAVRYVKIKEGSPYFHEEWIKGALITTDGKAYTKLDIRLNLLDDEVNYKDSDGQEKIATTPLQAVIIGDSAYGTKYVFIRGDKWSVTDRTLSRSWVQVLVNDKVSLVRQIKKNVKVTTPYGSSTDEEAIIDIEVYYLQISGQFIRIRNWDALPILLQDKKDQIVQYIHSNHLRGRLPEEYAQVVSYYNSLISALPAKK